MNIFDKSISIEKCDVMSVVCSQQIATTGLPILYASIHIDLEKSSHVLIMIGAVCSSIFKNNDQFYFFDSHSRGPYELSCHTGKAVLVSFTRLEYLITFLILCITACSLTYKHSLTCYQLN